MPTPLEQYYTRRAAKKEANRQSLAEATAILRERSRQAAKAADVRAQSAGDYVTPSGEIDRSMGRLGTWGSQAVRGFGSMVGAVPKGLADITQLATGYDPEGLRETGEDIDEFFQQADVNPDYAESIGGKIAHGVGTTAGFFAGGVAGTGVKGLSLAAKGAKATSLLKGASVATKLGMPVTSGINEMTEDFRRTMGRDPTREELATLVPTGTALGAMEYLPVASGINRFGRATGGKKLLGGKAGEVAMGTAEEFIQEGSQQVAQNYAAKYIAKYDKDRDVFEGLGEAATVGGASGFIINSALMLAGVKMRGSQKDAEDPGNTIISDEDAQADLDKAKEKALSDFEKSAKVRRDLSAKNKELAKAKESEGTNPEEVKAIEKELKVLTDEFFALRDEGVREQTIPGVEGEALPEEAFGEVTEEIELGDERIGAAQLEADAALAQLEQEDLDATVQNIESEEAFAAGDIEPIDGDVLPKPPGPYADRPGARPAPTKKEMVDNRIKNIYGDNLLLEKTTEFGEEWNAGPIPGQYPGRNFVRSSEAKVAGEVTLPPALEDAMRADTVEADAQQKEAKAKLPKAKKTAKKKAGKPQKGAEETRKRATLPSVGPVSVAAKRGKAGKNTVAKIAKALNGTKASAPVAETTGSPKLDKIRSDISDWADKKGSVPIGEYNKQLSVLKTAMRNQMLEERPIIEGEKKGTANREVNKKINKYIKEVTPTKEITDANVEEAETVAPTTTESFMESVAEIPGATVNEDGSISVPVDNKGTVEGPTQMKELFQQENLSELRMAFNRRNADTTGRVEGNRAYSNAFQRYIMSKLKQPKTASDELLSAELRMEIRNAVELLSNEGILPAEFTSVGAQAEMVSVILEEYKAGSPMVANIVQSIEVNNPIDEKTGKRNVKNKLPIDLGQKEELNEALSQTGLHIRSYNKSTGMATLVNENKHTKGQSPTQVLGNAETYITITPEQADAMVNPEPVTKAPERETPLFDQAEADKVSPVTDPRFTEIDTIPFSSTAAKKRFITLFEAGALTDDSMSLVDPSGKGGKYTVKDILEAVKAEKQINDTVGTSDLGITEDTGEQIVAQQEGSTSNRLASAVQAQPITEEEADTAVVSPVPPPFPSEGTTPRTESGEVEIDPSEDVTELERKLYSGETLTAEEQTRLDKEILDDLTELDDYTASENIDEDTYQAPLKVGAAEAMTMYSPAGKAVRNFLSKGTGKVLKLQDALATIYDSLPHGSPEKELVKILKALKLTTTISLDGYLGKPELADNVGGDYSRTQEHIRVSNTGLDSDLTWVTLHEAIHAATIHGYGFDMRFKEEIDSIYQTVKEAYDKIGTKLPGVDYGMTSPTEFLAEIFTNPMMMKFANDVHYTSAETGTLRSAFSKFLESLSRFFGIASNENSALRAALITGHNGLRNQAQIESILDYESQLLYDIEQEDLYGAPATREDTSGIVGDTLEKARDEKGKVIPRPFAPQEYDHEAQINMMNELKKIPQQMIDSAHGVVAGWASGWHTYLRNVKPFSGYRLLKDMVDQRSYLAGRNLSMGDASTFDEMGTFFARNFSNMSTGHMELLTDYMTQKTGDVNLLPEALRAPAQNAKEEIMKMGDEMVRLGVLDPNLHEATKGGYLGRMYLLFMTLPNERGQVSTTGGTGAKASLMEYLKKKSLNDEHMQELYGFVTDPALRVANTISKVGRDIGIFRFMENINTFAQMQGEDPWVFPDGDTTIRLRDYNQEGELVEVTKPMTIPEALARLNEHESKLVTRGAVSEVEGETLSEGFVRENRALIEQKLASVQAERAEAITDETERERFEGGNFAALDIKKYTKLAPDPRNGKLAGKWVRNEIFNDLRSNTFAFSTENASTAEKLLGQNSTLTKANKIWKATKTIYNLPAHPRNFISNFINFDTSTDTPTTTVMKLVHDTAKEWYLARTQDGLKYPNSYIWQLADASGMTEATWTAQETIQFGNDWQFDHRKKKPPGWVSMLPNGGMKDHFTEQLPHMTGRGVSFLSKIAGVYQGNETIFRVAKLKDEIEKMREMEPNATGARWKALEQIAVQNANEAIFDYTNVTQSVKYFRNAPIGAPFISFSYLAFPRIVENTAKHPVKMMKYIALPYLMGEFAASMGAFDDDDWETAKNKAPGFLKDKHTLLPMPWKDEHGKNIVWDLSYYLPYAPFLETAHQYKNIISGKDTETGVLDPVIRNFGILSGPVPDIISAAKTGIDPFTQQQIVDPHGSRTDKALDALMYGYSVAAPTFITNHGLLGNMYRQFTDKGNINPRTGLERTSMTEGVLRGLGTSVYSYDAADSRGVNARYYKSLLNKQKQADRKKIKQMYVEGASFEKIAKERKNAANRQKIYRRNHQEYLEETE